jgi:hypothetical protein
VSLASGVRFGISMREFGLSLNQGCGICRAANVAPLRSAIMGPSRYKKYTFTSLEKKDEFGVERRRGRLARNVEVGPP